MTAMTPTAPWSRRRPNSSRPAAPWSSRPDRARQEILRPCWLLPRYRSTGRPRPTWRAFPGPCRPEKCPHKSRIGLQKTSWNIPWERLRSGQHIGAGPVDLRAKAGLSGESFTDYRFQAAGPVERDGQRCCAALRPQSERKPDIALEDLRNTAGLVSAGDMNGFAGNGCWRVGNASLLNATVDEHRQGSIRPCARCARGLWTAVIGSLL